MCLMDAAGGKERCSSTREIPLTSIISPLQKWKQLSCRAKKREDGGCSCQTEILSRAVIRITCLQAAMKYRRDGCARKKEDRPPFPLKGELRSVYFIIFEFRLRSCISFLFQTELLVLNSSGG